MRDSKEKRYMRSKRTTNDFSFWRHAFLFSLWNKTLPDIPEKHPVKDKVDDYEGGEYQARVIMHCHPLGTGNVEIR